MILRGEAEAMARRLKAHWIERGGDVAMRVEVEDLGRGVGIHNVRSDMINGMPRSWYAGKSNWRVRHGRRRRRG